MLPFGSFVINTLRIAALMVLVFVCLPSEAHAQKTDTYDTLHVDNNRSGVFVKTDSGNIQKLIGDVILRKGTDTLYCDSAYLNTESNNIEAFSNVRMAQPGGTEAVSDYLRYTSRLKEAYMKGNVSLTDGENKLWCEELTYNTGTKIGVYTQEGTLQSEATVVTSNEGIYNVKTKDSRFKGDVFITDPDYTIRSEDLTYNTETKKMEFFAPSTVTSDSSVLRTTCGTYDAKKGLAHFECRSSVTTQDQYLEGDTLHYNKAIGYGRSTGNVISIDTVQHTTLYCGRVDYFEKSKRLWATIKPVLKKVNDTDSVFIRADTFYSAPMPVKDTLKSTQKTAIKDSATKKALKDTTNAVTKTSSVKRKKKEPVIPIDSVFLIDKFTHEDTLTADSSAPRYFIGYHHVLIFSDSMQGKCDSISYTQTDSVLRMMYDPILWSRRSQITGDTILLYTDSSELKKMFVPNNAFVVSASGPPKANLFDQVQGKTLTAYFANNEITHMVVWPSAETIYYSKDDSGAYIGANQATSERLRIYFKEQAIDRISFDENVNQTMTPMDQVDIPAMRLSRYQWHEAKRPKSKEELFK